jgi:hypothetical protein
MRLVICPGVHEPKLTDCFLTGLSGLWGLAADRQNQQIVEPVKIFPAHKYPPFSALDIWHFLCSEELAGESLVFVSFSAGVAGAIGAAWMWQQLGGKVGAFFALDGWGVPLAGNFPIHRISHDRFTHWSSAILGGGGESFYADPRSNIWIYGELPKRQKAGTSAKPPPALRLSHPQPQQNF